MRTSIVHSLLICAAPLAVFALGAGCAKGGGGPNVPPTGENSEEIWTLPAGDSWKQINYLPDPDLALITTTGSPASGASHLYLARLSAKSVTAVCGDTRPADIDYSTMVTAAGLDGDDLAIWPLDIVCAQAGAASSSGSIKSTGRAASTGLSPSDSLPLTAQGFFANRAGKLVFVAWSGVVTPFADIDDVDYRQHSPAANAIFTAHVDQVAGTVVVRKIDLGTRSITAVGTSNYGSALSPFGAVAVAFADDRGVVVTAGAHSVAQLYGGAPSPLLDAAGSVMVRDSFWEDGGKAVIMGNERFDLATGQQGLRAELKPAVDTGFGARTVFHRYTRSGHLYQWLYDLPIALYVMPSGTSPPDPKQFFILRPGEPTQPAGVRPISFHEFDDGSCAVNWAPLTTADGNFNLFQSGTPGSDGLFPGGNFTYRARCGESTFTEVASGFFGRVVNHLGPAFYSQATFDRTDRLTFSTFHGEKLPMRRTSPSNGNYADAVDTEYDVTYSGWQVDASGNAQALFHRVNAYYLRLRGSDPFLALRGDKLLVVRPPS